MIQLFFGFIAEGNSDYEFLTPIIEKTLIEIAQAGRGVFDVDVKKIDCGKGDSFSQFVFNASKVAWQDLGMHLLIVHSDADNESNDNTYINKINPAKEFIEQQIDTECCKNMIALVPIYETESWMLADKELFKKTIGTKKSESELNINGHPERINNPKERIIEAIRIGRAELPKKMRNNLDIKDLYSYLGEALRVEKLESFNSYIDFKNNVKQELVKLSLLTNY